MKGYTWELLSQFLGGSHTSPERVFKKNITGTIVTVIPPQRENAESVTRIKIEKSTRGSKIKRTSSSNAAKSLEKSVNGKDVAELATSPSQEASSLSKDMEGEGVLEIIISTVFLLNIL